MHFYNHGTYTCLGSIPILVYFIIITIITITTVAWLYVFESTLHTSYFPSSALRLALDGAAPTYMFIFPITGLPASLCSHLRTLLFLASAGRSVGFHPKLYTVIWRSWVRITPVWPPPVVTLPPHPTWGTKTVHIPSVHLKITPTWVRSID